ncbi:MAG: hypothetical protein ACLQO7_03055 [Candidatus Bathyarchaeia archaeon]
MNMLKIDNNSESNHDLKTKNLIFGGCTELFIGLAEEIWVKTIVFVVPIDGGVATNL